MSFSWRAPKGGDARSGCHPPYLFCVLTVLQTYQHTYRNSTDKAHAQFSSSLMPLECCERLIMPCGHQATCGGVRHPSHHQMGVRGYPSKPTVSHLPLNCHTWNRISNNYGSETHFGNIFKVQEMFKTINHLKHLHFLNSLMVPGIYEDPGRLQVPTELLKHTGGHVVYCHLCIKFPLT